jgi:AMP-activated protein kinase-like protein
VSDVEFESRLATALHAAVRTDARAKEAIMVRVRGAAAEDRLSGRDRRLTRRRGTRHSLVGLALAAGIGSVTTVSALLPSAHAGASTTSVVIGDTVVATLRDTLRLVRLMFDDPGARRVSVVGDFNGWRADETPLHQDVTTRRWSATLALHDGAHRYAFVVDGTRWAPDRATAGALAGDQLVYSLLHVARDSN